MSGVVARLSRHEAVFLPAPLTRHRCETAGKVIFDTFDDRGHRLRRLQARCRIDRPFENLRRWFQRVFRVGFSNRRSVRAPGNLRSCVRHITQVAKRGEVKRRRRHLIRYLLGHAAHTALQIEVATGILAVRVFGVVQVRIPGIIDTKGPVIPRAFRQILDALVRNPLDSLGGAFDGGFPENVHALDPHVLSRVYQVIGAVRSRYLIISAIDHRDDVVGNFLEVVERTVPAGATHVHRFGAHFVAVFVHQAVHVELTRAAFLFGVKVRGLIVVHVF
mmetsp:Transcript_8132/g.33979  ORF Transcript_8132/g.33979 Transcript_8132/m.33979 type:complete len:276 (+) Transcript_8132:4298-5125(+)